MAKRHISVETAIEKNKVVSATPIIILMEINLTNPNTRVVDEVIRIARNDENITFNGELYLAGNFNVSVNNKKGEQASIDLTASDPTGFIRSKMDAYAGGVVSTVQLMTVNADRLDKPEELSEKFSVISSSVKDVDLTFRLGVANALAFSFPRNRQFRDRCSWRFKGYGCQYAGPDSTCSYTFDGPNGCLAKGNQKNYGGLRGLVPLNV